jgi:hypothetical protein
LCGLSGGPGQQGWVTRSTWVFFGDGLPAAWFCCPAVV